MPVQLPTIDVNVVNPSTNAMHVSVDNDVSVKHIIDPVTVRVKQQEWEYEIISLNLSDLEQIRRELKKLGELSFELVGIFGAIAVFKRPS